MAEQSKIFTSFRVVVIAVNSLPWLHSWLPAQWNPTRLSGGSAPTCEAVAESEHERARQGLGSRSALAGAQADVITYYARILRCPVLGCLLSASHADRWR